MSVRRAHLPLVLRDQLERVGVAVVIRLAVLVVGGVGEFSELVRPHGILVVDGVDERLWGADVPAKNEVCIRKHANGYEWAYAM